MTEVMSGEKHRWCSQGRGGLGVLFVCFFFLAQVVDKYHKFFGSGLETVLALWL